MLQLATLILLSVLITSTISGVLGMAGGMILMAILVLALNVPTAMMVHGAVQASSNGSRAWFLREHIRWSILPPYVVGSLIVLALFALVTFVADPAVILITIGVFPFLARLVKRLHGLNITRPLTAAASGAVVTTAQLLAGASGPLLDVFYLNAPLNRHEIVACKAVTQTLGHLLKLLYYGWIIGIVVTEQGQDASVPTWLLLTAIATAVIGTRMGTRLLARFSDEHFRSVSGAVILVIGAACIAAGIRQLWVG